MTLKGGMWIRGWGWTVELKLNRKRRKEWFPMGGGGSTPYPPGSAAVCIFPKKETSIGISVGYLPHPIQLKGYRGQTIVTGLAILLQVQRAIGGPIEGWSGRTAGG